MLMPRWISYALLLLPVVVAAAPQGPPLLRSSVDLVRLDLSVLDSDRRPVRGLSSKDFSVTVDGVPQQITTFEEVVAPDTREVDPTLARFGIDVAVNSLAPPRLVVIIMDDAGTDADPALIASAKRLGHEVLRQGRPSDLTAVIFTSPFGSRKSQELTRDRILLATAVESFNFGTGGTTRIFTERTIRDVVAVLQTRPDLRASIVIISPALWDELFSHPVFTRPMLAGVRIPIYWFDPSGLGSGAGLAGNEMGSQPRRGVPGAVSLLAPAYIAESGGREVRNTNEPESAVASALAENDSYYLLSYRPTYPLNDKRIRRIKIEVKREGLSLFPGERLIGPEAPLTAGRDAASLKAAIADLVPRSELSLRMQAIPFSGDPTQPKVPVVVAIQVVPGDARTDRIAEDVFEVLGTAFDTRGRPRASTTTQFRVRRKEGGASAAAEVFSRLDLPPGRYSLRYAVRLQSDGRTGSVYGDVAVPDVEREPLSISGLIVASTGALAASPEWLKALVPASPTTVRECSPTETIRVSGRVYRGRNARGPADVLVDARLIDARGRESQLRRWAAPVQHGAAGAWAGFELTLPNRLPAGHYALLVTAAADSRSVQQSVLFSVK